MNDKSAATKSILTVAAPVTAELVEKKSRFLCLLAPVREESEVQAHLAAIRKTHWNATHHCYAYRLRDGTERASDDGEPSGTAGRPMLHTLASQGLSDVLAIVTRYFGGTLLGAGGLVRAYSGAVAEALQAVQVVAYAPHETYKVDLTYADYERARAFFAHEPRWRVEEAYADVVTLTLTVPLQDAVKLREWITATTKGVGSVTPVSHAWLPLIT